MVEGSGLIANAFMGDYKDDDRYLIYARGISNSKETDEAEFRRDEELLRESLSKNKDKHIVYFSTITDSSSDKVRYAVHKKLMETIILASGNDYTILNIPQVIGNGGNKNSLINFIVRSIKNGETLNIYSKTWKALLDVEDLKKIVDISLKIRNDKNIYLPIPYIEKKLVYDIVFMIASELGIEAKVNLIDSKDSNFPKMTKNTKDILDYLNIISVGYTSRVIKKYISNK